MKLVNECLEKVKNDYFKFLKREKIYKKSMLKHIKHLKEIYIPIAFWINKKFEIKNKTLVIGLSAGQGSGKTTVASILRIILKVFFKRNVFVISIDDFYNTSFYQISFSEGNELSILEIESKEDQESLNEDKDLIFFNFQDSKYIYRLATNDRNKLIKLKNNFKSNKDILKINLNFQK